MCQCPPMWPTQLWFSPGREADVAEEAPGDRGRDLTTQFGWWLLRTILVATGLALAGWLMLELCFRH